MGCDMHAIIETKAPDGNWEFETDIDIIRNYALFANLANVRNDGSVIPWAEPRGLPDDLSEGAEEFKEDCAFIGHSASWAYPCELAAHEFNADLAPFEFIPKWLTDFILRGGDSARLVFYFDN